MEKKVIRRKVENKLQQHKESAENNEKNCSILIRTYDKTNIDIQLNPQTEKKHFIKEKEKAKKDEKEKGNEKSAGG